MDRSKAREPSSSSDAAELARADGLHISSPIERDQRGMPSRTERESSTYFARRGAGEQCEANR